MFNDDGTTAACAGQSWRLSSSAILLDGEVRNLAAGSATSSGKQREHLLRIAAPARTFPYTAYSGTYSQAAGSPYLTVTLGSGAANRFVVNDLVGLDFSGNATGTPPTLPYNNPTNGSYKVLGTPTPTATSFAVTALGIASASYTVKAQTTTPVTYLTTVATPGPSVLTDANGNKAYGKAYLQFIPAGSGPDGLYTVTDPSGTNMQVYTATSPATGTGTSVVVPKFTGYYNITTPTGSSVSTVTVVSYANHNLRVGDKFWMDITLGGTTPQLTSGEYTVATVVNGATVTVVNSAKYSNDIRNLTIYPQSAPMPARSGVVTQAASKFDMGSTSTLLVQTPMNSPTVFNYFYPDYKYPGPLAAANITTPEFQLTTDTNILTLTNNISATILSGSNTNGLCSFSNGAILLDLAPYMSAPWSVADAAGVGALVDKMSNLLTGGLITQATKAEIVNYVTGSTTVGTKTTMNFPTTNTTNVRDRVRAVVQLILISPEYAIQR